MKYQIFASGINTYFEQCELLILQNEELIDPKYNTAKHITDNTSLIVFADSGVEQAAMNAYSMHLRRPGLFRANQQLQKLLELVQVYGMQDEELPDPKRSVLNMPFSVAGKVKKVVLFQRSAEWTIIEPEFVAGTTVKMFLQQMLNAESYLYNYFQERLKRHQTNMEREAKELIEQKEQLSVKKDELAGKTTVSNDEKNQIRDKIKSLDAQIRVKDEQIAQKIRNKEIPPIEFFESCEQLLVGEN